MDRSLLKYHKITPIYQLLFRPIRSKRASTEEVASEIPAVVDGILPPSLAIKQLEIL